MNPQACTALNPALNVLLPNLLMNGAWRSADIAHREPMLIKWALPSVILATKATRGLRVCLAPHADLVLEATMRLSKEVLSVLPVNQDTGTLVPGHAFVMSHAQTEIVEAFDQAYSHCTASSHMIGPTKLRLEV